MSGSSGSHKPDRQVRKDAPPPLPPIPPPVQRPPRAVPLASQHRAYTAPSSPFLRTRDIALGAILAAALIASVAVLFVIGHRYQSDPRDRNASDAQSQADAADAATPRAQRQVPLRKDPNPEIPREAAGPVPVVAKPPEEKQPVERPEKREARGGNVNPQFPVESVEKAVVRIEVSVNGGTAEASGFVFDRRTVITNYHVIEGAKAARVFLKDGGFFEVKGFKGIAPRSDLAVLEVDLPADTPALPLANGPPKKGEEVWAIGTPKGLQWSVTRGVISAHRTGREVRESLR